MNNLTTKTTDQMNERFVEELLHRVPGYVPEWNHGGSSKGEALLRVFGRYMDVLRAGMAQVPERSRLAFLDMLGIGLLPAQGARAPLVFSLVENSPLDVSLPARSEVAAQVLPRVSASGPPTAAGTGTPQSLIFSTEQTIVLARAQINALYSTIPGSDEWVDHTTNLTSGFTLFADGTLSTHAIYLGHDELLALAGDISVIVSFTFASGAAKPLPTTWEYLTEQGWLPFTVPNEDDTTDGLRNDGQVVMRRACGPKAKQETIEGRTSYWVRGRLTKPLLPDGTDGQRTVPIVNDIRIRVAIHKEGIAPDAAFTDVMPLDISKDFFPFGEQPAKHPTFYLASKEVFQRKGAQIQIGVELSQVGVVPTGTTLTVQWEYFDGAGWSLLSHQSTAGVDIFTATKGSLHFLCPRDWAETKVNGTQNYWLRVRIAGGHYGQPLRVTGVTNNTPTLTQGDLRPPIIKTLSLAYTYTTDPAILDHCLTENEFVLSDETEACRWADRTFIPFRPLSDQRPSVHIGFDQPLPTGLLSLYVDVPRTVVGDGMRTQGSPFLWEYRSSRGWTELGVLDETLGFRRSGMIQFIGPPDAIRTPGLGGSLIRLRARLKPGERMEPLAVGGIWLNAVWAQQSRSIEQEPLGMTDGNPDQTFVVQRRPVLEGGILEIQEWIGNGDGWRFDLNGVPEDDLRVDRNQSTQAVTVVWVRWKERPHFYRTTPRDRSYVIDRSRGMIRLGDGAHGMTPPAGRSVRFSYRTSDIADSQLVSTVPVGAINELRTAVPFVGAVTNPVAGGGGAVVEALSRVTLRGAQRVRHGGRGISAEDLEWLARDARPEVARARCLALTGPAGHAQRGWVTLLIVPFSQEAQPQPSAETMRLVRDYVAARGPATISSRIRVTGAQYTRVGVRAHIVPRQADQAAAIEARLRENLNRFLHPLTGGVDGEGWEFGQAPRLSQIARVIEETVGVDYATEVMLMNEGHLYQDLVPIHEHGLLAAGDHELTLTVGAR